jgi:hypothetical protein
MIIAAHVDREVFSIISQLGYIPEGIDLDGLELVRPDSGNLYAYPVISCSDAHYIEDIGKRTVTLMLEEPDIKEIMMALKGENGRSIITYS